MNDEFEYSNAENIQNKLLQSLGVGDKVACVFSCSDLTVLIEALSEIEYPDDKQGEMLQNLSAFRASVFGV